MQAPADFSWTNALDALGRGVHDLAGIGRVRAICALLGIEALPLHPLEALEARRLREEARRLDKAATAIEQRAVVE